MAGFFPVDLERTLCALGCLSNRADAASAFSERRTLQFLIGLSCSFAVVTRTCRALSVVRD